MTTSDIALGRLASACGESSDLTTLLDRALPLVVEATGSGTAYVVDGPLDDASVPPTALTYRLSEDPGGLVLVVAPDEGHDAPAELLEAAAAILATAVRRFRAEADLADLTQRVDNAQHLAGMGDYDWHIASDTNRWSDQLYRIYGHEPQSFNASYERFISHIHPDDRERIMAIHQRAYATGEPYQMIERIQRPDGETRYLSSNGQVIMDETGTPVRMRGTCIDITDLVLAEQEVERVSRRFEALVESSGDAIMVLDAGLVVQTNARGRALLGGDPVGQPLERFVRVDEAEALGVAGRRIDGEELVLDVFARELNPGAGDALVAVFLRDAAPRLASEALAVTLGEAQVRRRQAVEINDNIIQGLAAAVYSLDRFDVSGAAEYVRLTLSSARTMMNDLLERLDGQDLQPGDLVRDSGANLRDTGGAGHAEQTGPSRPVDPPAPTERKVLIVDDSEDMRALVRHFLEREEGLRVVGEAETGRHGIRLAEELQPDLVLLDLAMPEVDGLEALPLILVAAPGTKVIVLSGFDARLGDRAVAAGAAHFVQKGGGVQELLHAIHRTLPA